MQLTRESEYALDALIHLVRKPGPVVLVRLAEEAGLPRAFLAKAFQKLARHDIVHGSPGGARGYVLARPPGQVSIREVLEAIEGPDVFERCIFWGGRCASRNPCRLHGRYAPLAEERLRVAEETNLSDLAGRESRRGRPP